MSALHAAVKTLALKTPDRAGVRST
jgi:hypothetical protein